MATTPTAETIELTIRRAVEVVAENTARRFAAGQEIDTAFAGAIAEFAARWPELAAVVADVLGASK